MEMTQTNSDLLLLLAACCGLLVIATLIGEVLRARLHKTHANLTVETYLTRVHSWWGMVFLFSIALLLGPVGIITLFAFCSLAALREFLTLTTKTNADHWSLIASFYVILPFQYVLIWWGEVGLFSTLIPIYAFLLLPILSVLRGGEGADKNFLARISETQWGLMICVFCASYIPALVTLDIPGYGDRAPLLIAYLVFVIQMGDLMEYFAGRRIGRRKVAPAVSPKTREGIACGAALAAGLGLLLTWMTPFSPLVSMAMAVMAYMVGVGGSLVLAAIKSDRGIKNWGHLIPGQGGFVDQLDSVVFAAPVFFHITRYYYGG
ncbi:phosphatidate cytidylyltransferase [Litoreibacter halocynthiae]|uniref:phosphatidate cytidylyltransferase n=1 Tax=Litoreibacter halocynthiae TaxID=1242689 RepID=UPI0032B37974